MANLGCGAEATWYQYVPRGYDYKEYTMKASCGDTQTDYQGYSEKRLCDPCQVKYERQYPQGWETYPGDKCPHGVYVGGMGLDYMCGICEDSHE